MTADILELPTCQHLELFTTETASGELGFECARCGETWEQTAW